MQLFLNKTMKWSMKLEGKMQSWLLELFYEKKECTFLADICVGGWKWQAWMRWEVLKYIEKKNQNQNETEMKTHSHNCATYYGTCIEWRIEFDHIFPLLHVHTPLTHISTFLMILRPSLKCFLDWCQLPNYFSFTDHSQ